MLAIAWNASGRGTANATRESIRQESPERGTAQARQPGRRAGGDRVRQRHRQRDRRRHRAEANRQRRRYHGDAYQGHAEDRRPAVHVDADEEEQPATEPVTIRRTRGGPPSRTAPFGFSTHKSISPPPRPHAGAVSLRRLVPTTAS